MFAQFADTSMIRQLVTKIMESKREQLLQIFRKIGFAHFAE